jgi:hypothetical protein
VSLPDTSEGTPTEIRRRYRAGLRTTPLCDGLHRDPILHDVEPHGHSTYDLTVAELRAEYRRLRAAGWSPGEIAQRLCLREVTAA